MRVVWTPEAQQDRADVWDYIAADNPRAAARMDEIFSDAAARLIQHPMLGKPGKIPGTRELIPHESYRLVYQIDGETVWILTNACVRSRSDHTPCGLLLYLRCYLALRDISSSKQEVAEHVIRHPNVMRQNCRPKTKLGRMDTTQVTLIHKILAAADERNLPLWIGGGWAIDARLGRVTRKHDDIDLTFPGERRGELEAIVEMLGGRVMEELDYGFLAEIGDELLDCEPAWWADEAYEIAEAPQGSCPEAAEGVIAGRPVRCNSWEAIIWDYFYYADEVPPVDWPTKHIESYRLACTSLGAEKVEVLRAAFRSRYAA